MVREGIREVEAGAFEMRSDEASIAAYQATFTSWASGSLHASNPGGETGHEAFARFNNVITEAASTGTRTVALISHGAMLRSWAGYHCRNLDAQYVDAHPLPNTGIIEVSGSTHRGWTAESWIGKAINGPLLDGPADSRPAGEARERGF